MGRGALYNNATFGVFLSDAEGWNRPLMECLASGTPSICSNVTGHTEYLDDYPEILKVNPTDKNSAHKGDICYQDDVWYFFRNGRCVRNYLIWLPGLITILNERFIIMRLYGLVLVGNQQHYNYMLFLQRNAFMKRAVPQ